jgi:type II secretory pathway component PulF
MATFEYHALTPHGRLLKGTIEAGSPEEAGELLGDMDLTVNHLLKAKPPRSVTPLGRSEFLLFNQQLASITKAGIPLEKGLRELANDIASSKMRRLVMDIAHELESGIRIEEAFEKRQHQFPPLYGRILKAGVKTGRLSEMLTSLNRHLELSDISRRIIFEAISYPAVVLFFAAVIITGIFIFVIPQFESILQEMVGGQLNPLTRVVMSMARNVLPFWTVVGCLIGGAVFGWSALSSSTSGQLFKESLILHIPILGSIYKTCSLSRFSETMALMVAAGSDMPTGIRLAADTCTSPKVIVEAENLAQRVEQGSTIIEAGQFCRMIPQLFLYSMQLGIQRNELQDNLHSLGQMYSDQARYAQTRLQNILLPLMIVFVGGIVLLAILAIFLPMIQVITSMSSAG